MGNKTPVPFDVCFLVVEQAPFLDAIEASLKEAGKPELAESLISLQADCALKALNEHGHPDDPNVDVLKNLEGPYGEEGARIQRDYRPMTMDRLNILRDISAALEADGNEQAVTFQSFLRQVMPVPAVPSQNTPKITLKP